MDNLSERVKELLNLADLQDRYFLHRRPSLNQISKGLANFENFINNKVLEGKRINMSKIYSLEDDIVGYNAFTVMQNAIPTSYEKNFMDMGNNLNYIHLKQLFVHPDFRGQGIGTELLKNNLEFAEKLDKHCIIDVEKDNYKMINILTGQGFSGDYRWESRSGKHMIRFFYEKPDL